MESPSIAPENLMPTDELKGADLHEILDTILTSKSGKILGETTKRLDELSEYTLFL